MQSLFQSQRPPISGDESPTGNTDISASPGSQTVNPRTAIPKEFRSHSDRPWIYTNMITSADGGTAVSGLSGGLGTESDRTVFGSLRSVADVILVGAETVRAENYGSPGSSPESLVARSERSQEPHPRLAIVSRQLDLPTSLRVFEDESNRPLIFTGSSAPMDRREALATKADVVIAGETDVDLVQATDHLAQLGVQTVLSEGGPSLNGQLITADLVDEWNLSISPLLLGSDSKRAAVGQAASGPPAGMQLERVWLGDDVLFCRWVRK